MSTYYSLIKKIPGDDVFDGRLEEFGVREHIVPDQTTNTYRCLTDGRNYVWVRMDGNGFFWHVRGRSKILYIVADVFETDIVSEHQAQFWGFDTQEEWDAWNRAEATKAEEDFYKEPEAAEAATAAPRRIAARQHTASGGPSSRSHRCLFMPTSCLPARVLFRPASLRRAFQPKPTRCRPAACGCIRLSNDGFRIIGRKDGERVRLYSRPGNDFTRRFPLIVETLARPHA